jgi:hypothetical protein
MSKWLGSLLPKAKEKTPAVEPPPAAAPEGLARFVVLAADKVLLFACIAVIVLVYILDVLFFSSTGGDLWPVFILFGLVLRSFAVGTGVVLNTLRGVKWIEDSRRTIRAIGLGCFVACLFPPINFFAASHFEKASEAQAVTDVSDASTTSKTVRIDRQKDRLERAKETRDTSVKAAQEAMAIIKDQVVGTSAADNATLQKLQGDITGYINGYSSTEKEINGAIETIEREQETAQTEAAGKKAVTFHTWPVFIWLGEQFPFWGTGSDLVWANWSLFYFAMLVEFCALLSLGAYVRIHGGFMAVLKPTADEKPAPVVVTVTAPAADPVQPQPGVAQPQDELQLTPQQIWGKKGADAKKHKKTAAAANDWIPVDDLSERFENGVGA